MLAASIPDLDLLIAALLDRLGVEHELNTGVHHRWVTHTPLFWGLVLAEARRLSRRRGAPGWAPGAVELLRSAANPYALATTLLDRGLLLVDLGRSTEATAALREARALFEDLRATPWIERTDRALAPLVTA